ncbi:hypothetical protein NE237_032580 [Protea cynaroides]|uniref:Uncharacterized protein n=1 Tax=Protea cynaroides TaxID=273540 RepID=A0A9Q0L3B0_9MAGN|nr:hypothetical protein NE237_032580 [Protea cynaroides]
MVFEFYGFVRYWVSGSWFIILFYIFILLLFLCDNGCLEIRIRCGGLLCGFICVFLLFRSIWFARIWFVFGSEFGQASVVVLVGCDGRGIMDSLSGFCRRVSTAKTLIFGQKHK